MLILRDNPYVIGDLRKYTLDELLEYGNEVRQKFNPKMKISNIEECSGCEAIGEIKNIICTIFRRFPAMPPKSGNRSEFLVSLTPGMDESDSFPQIQTRFSKNFEECHKQRGKPQTVDLWKSFGKREILIIFSISYFRGS